jgi:tRNA (cmo5U34)-methyltransferase
VTIEQVFDNSTATYDSWMKRALPCYDQLFGIATQVMPFERDAPIDVLDLGAGTGLFSEHVLKAFPNGTFVLWDLAKKMLGAARERSQLVIDDYRNLRDRKRFDLVISSLSIHHLADEEKRKLCQQVYAALKAGGTFVNVDQIKGETAYLQNLYWELWLRHARASGAPEEQIQESVERRTAYDQDALLSDQLRWLREAGFVNVDCVYRHTFVGVFFAMKRSKQ